MRIRAIQLFAPVALAAAACYGQETISTLGGTLYSACSTADGVQALTACMSPGGMVMDKLGNLYFSDGRYFKIRKIDNLGIVTTVAGTTSGYSGDGGPATSAQMSLAGGSPALAGLALDAAGSLYISDTGNNVIRMIDHTTNIITTVAGNNSPGDAGDGGPAAKASLQTPRGIAVDSAGNLYIADQGNNLVRKVTGGIISTFAGNGDALYSGDGVQAKTTAVVHPMGLAFDSAGNLYISESDRIRKVDSGGIITTIAGKTSDVETPGFSGDGGPATAALLSGPLGMAVDSSNNLYFADANNERIRKITAKGIISTYAGVPGNVSTPLGDGGPAIAAYLGMTRDVVLDAAGDLFIAASPGTYDNIRKVSAPGAFVCTNTTAPVISSVNSAGSYGGYPYFASGSWLEIFGANLADPSGPHITGNGGQWASADFINGVAPTSLDGVSVSINGKPAYVWFLSPGQINVQAPEDSATGSVSITVTNCQATSSVAMLTRRPLAPGLLAPANYTANGKQYLVATFASDGAYVLNTSTGAAFGLNSRPAKPGDVILAYGIGFGEVTPTILPGVVVQQANALVDPITVSFGTTNATLSYSGLAGSFVGLYEFYITVPSGLADGDYQINVTQNGTNLPQTFYLTVHN